MPFLTGPAHGPIYTINRVQGMNIHVSGFTAEFNGKLQVWAIRTGTTSSLPIMELRCWQQTDVGFSPSIVHGSANNGLLLVPCTDYEQEIYRREAQK